MGASVYAVLARRPTRASEHDPCRAGLAFVEGALICIMGPGHPKINSFFLGSAAPTTRDVGRRQVPHRAQLYATIPWRGSAPANGRATNLDPRLPRNPGRCHAEMRPQPVACHRGSSAGHGSAPAVFPIATATVYATISRRGRRAGKQRAIIFCAFYPALLAACPAMAGRVWHVGRFCSSARL